MKDEQQPDLATLAERLVTIATENARLTESINVLVDRLIADRDAWKKRAAEAEGAALYLCVCGLPIQAHLDRAKELGDERSIAYWTQVLSSRSGR